MKVIAYIILSVIVLIIIVSQVEKYYDSLLQAYAKEINGKF